MPIGTDHPERMFIGVALAEEVRGKLDARLRCALPDGIPGRAVPTANGHLTLRLLGATRADQLAALRRRLLAATLGGGFRARFGGLGAFPRASRARVLWIGVEQGAAALGRLARIAEDAARPAGFPPEEMPYRPHLTLARLHPPRDVGPAPVRVPPLEVETDVREIILFRSHLGGGPPRYEPVERFRLE